ncbi:hypothetical protein GCM10023143_21110 [Compostibacter hankyongensis]|uniref:FecR family protein n=2 Tax=Compostibacter hankyongensis TaxID=1007089 RepID=A0ABP8FVH7_9BACT
MASEQELSELERLMREEGVQDFSGELIHRLWETPLKALPDEESEDTVWKHVKARMGDAAGAGRRKPAFRMSRRLAAAACLLAAVLGGSIYLLHKNARKPAAPVAEADARVNRIATQPLAKSKLELPDGTQVWLNEKSRLVYDNHDFNVNSREVTLTGEAFFDVTKNEKLPFVIHAGKVNIQVLGTAFNIKAYAGQKNVEAALIRGKIALSYAGDPDRRVLLKPNHKILLPIDRFPDPEEGKPVYTILPLARDKQGEAVETAWMKGKLAFDNESFGVIAQRMDDWYGIHFHFGSDSLRDLHFSGVIDKETLREALEAMQLSRHFTFRIEDREVWIGR